MTEIENLNTQTDTATGTNGNGHGLRVRTSVKGGGPSCPPRQCGLNHSEAKGLRVRTSVKGGPGSGSGFMFNHSEAKGLQGSQGEGLASRKAKNFLAAAAVTMGVLASTAAPASAAGIPLASPIVGVSVTASGNQVLGNRIGTDASGTAVTAKVTIEHTGLSLPGVD